MHKGQFSTMKKGHHISRNTNQTQSVIATEKKKKGTKSRMCNFIRDSFPKLQTSSYFVPPMHFSKTVYEPLTDDVWIQKPIPVDDSDRRSDRTTMLVRACFDHMVQFEHEPMIVLFDYSFQDFLCNLDQACQEFFHTTKNIALKPVIGDFDVLIISRKYGFIVIEIKTLGDRVTAKQNVQDGCPVHGQDTETLQRVLKTKALKQLMKAQACLKDLFQDLRSDILVTQCFAFPNTSRPMVKDVLTTDSGLFETICRGFGVARNVHKANTPCPLTQPTTISDHDRMAKVLVHFLCAEEADFTHVCPKPAQNDPLRQWWTSLTNEIKVRKQQCNKDSLNTDYIDEFSPKEYEDIVSRFCGLYSKVVDRKSRSTEKSKSLRNEFETVRTVADCIHLTGINFGRSILRDDQLDILKTEERFVHLTGVPGSGKTLILGLKAIEWAKAGHQLVIIACEGLGKGSLVSLTLHDHVLKAVSGNTFSNFPPASGQTPDPGKVLSKNIRYEILSLKTNPNSLMIEMISKLEKGQGLRILLDETPLKATVEDLYQMLSEAHAMLVQANSLLLKMIECARHSSRVCDCLPEEEETKERIPKEEHFKDISFRHGIITRRLSFMKPVEDGLDILKTDHWKTDILLLDTACQDIQKNFSKLKLLCLAPNIVTSQDRKLLGDVLSSVRKEMLEASGILFNAHTRLRGFPVQKFTSCVMSPAFEQEDVWLWSSGIFASYQQEGFVIKELTTCVRCPPKVQEILQMAEKGYKQAAPQYTYTTENFHINPPLPTVGPAVKLINHAPHLKNVREVHDCVECAHALADYLLNTLRLGVKGNKLTAKDVIVSGSPIHDPDCTFIKVLNERGLPIHQERNIPTNPLPEPPPYEDKALLIGGNTLQGLEAKVVVYVPEIYRIPVEERSTDDASLQSVEQADDIQKCISRFDDWNKIYIWGVASRTVSLFVLFHV